MAIFMVPISIYAYSHINVDANDEKSAINLVHTMIDNDLINVDDVIHSEYCDIGIEITDGGSYIEKIEN